ncbi:MAG: hypothetical protein AAGA54_33980 [Myxococcota bacterium]
MNFFGHLVVARALGVGDDARLGSMLPDLLPMCGVRPASTSAGVQRGVTLHHRTDDVFHAAPPFRALEREGRSRLQAAGVRRGPSMAVAHVGVELLLDGVLADDDVAVADFQRTVPGSALVDWNSDEARARYDAMVSRLLAVDVPRVYADPDHVANALHRMLARRPRLALTDDETDAARTWLHHVRPRVEQARVPLTDGIVPAIRAQFTAA